MSWFKGIREKTVVFSFDKSGFLAHQREFKPTDLPVDLSGRAVMITGANSGIGLVTAKALSAMGADLHLLIRNPDKAEETKQAIRTAGSRGQLDVHIVDMSVPESIRLFCRQAPQKPLHALVHNAGALSNKMQINPEGIETTLATHVVGTFLLTRLLLEQLTAGQPSRVVFVSSGGMYTQRLDLKTLQSKDGTYKGTVAYAQAKRAQVILSEMLAERLGESGISTFCMHPGWVNTPGVQRSLPRFYRLTRAILRTPAQGADCIVWLSACQRIAKQTGLFWFDRQPVSTHRRNSTKESTQDREELWNLCCALSGVDFP